MAGKKIVAEVLNVNEVCLKASDPDGINNLRIGFRGGEMSRRTTKCKNGGTVSADAQYNTVETTCSGCAYLPKGFCRKVKRV